MGKIGAGIYRWVGAGFGDCSFLAGIFGETRPYRFNDSGAGWGRVF